MTHLKTFSTCLVALLLHSPTWADIYETTDAQGNPVFTDSPPEPGAEALDLQQTNLISAPASEPEEPVETSTPEPTEIAPPPEQESSPVVIHDSNNDDEDVYDDYSRRQRELGRIDASAPREVLDTQAPREVGDLDSQMPREVGDNGIEMPREVGDSNREIPREVGDSDREMPREVGDNDTQIPREVGDFPAEHGALHHR